MANRCGNEQPSGSAVWLAWLRRFVFRNMSAKIAALPMIATVLVVFVGGTLWTVWYSFTSSKMLPNNHFVGFDQYVRLFKTSRWNVSVHNLLVYGSYLAGVHAGHRLHSRRSDGPEDPVRERLPHHHALSLRPQLHCDRPGLAVDHVSRARAAGDDAQSRMDELHLRLDHQPGHGDLRPADRRPLAGHGLRHGAHAGRPARHRPGNLEGGAGRRHSHLAHLSVHRAADDARCDRHRRGASSDPASSASTTSSSR